MSGSHFGDNQSNPRRGTEYYHLLTRHFRVTENVHSLFSLGAKLHCTT